MPKELDDDLQLIDADIAEFLRSYGQELPPELLVGLPAVQESGGPLLALEPTDLVKERYRIEAELGRGAQGIVYRCWDLSLERRVALKILHPFLGRGAGAHRLRFEREAKTASRLSHTALCSVLDFGEHESFPFIVMKLIEGPSLADLIKAAAGAPVQLTSSTLSHQERIPQVAEFFELLAAGLEVAHQQGVIHRDVKPGNIVVEENGSPVLLDFGCARDDDHQQRLSQTDDVLGTINYLAPERLSPHADSADPRVDVYSLGVALFESLTGRRAFDAHSREATLKAVVDGRLESVRALVPQIPKDMATIVATATAREPARRYVSAAALAEDLRRFRAGRPIVARPVSWLLQSWMWTQRNRVVATLLSACVLGLLAVAWFWLEADQQKGRADVAQGHLLVTGLRAAADDLWPMRPQKAAAIDDWLQQASPFAAELGGLVDEVRRRAHYALTIEGESIINHQDAWERAIAESAATVPGLIPQLGLVPLGADPQSGLQEFLHLDSHVGALVQRGSDGRINFDGNSGIVLVLIPGGKSFTGGQSIDPSQGASYMESKTAFNSVQSYDLAPYFISKYEVTAGQWQRIMGTTPNRYPLSRAPTSADERALHPVEMITWDEAAEFAQRLGLRLPTEPEWEHAARAGGAMVWTRGLSAREQGERANCADTTAFEVGAKWTATCPEQNDGHYSHAPVDALQPNGFGLYHIVGNVWEWAAEWTLTPQEAADPNRVYEATLFRPLRGASFENPIELSLIANRQQHTTRYRNHSIGLRPALSPMRPN